MEACFLSSLNSSGYISQEALQQVGFCLGFLPQRLGRPLILKILYMAFLSIHFEPGIKMLCSSQFNGKIFFSKTSWPKVLPHLHADDIRCWRDLCVCQWVLAAHPFPQRDISLSEVLRTYRLPISLFPNRCQQLDLAFRLTPGVETFPNHMNGPQT